MALPTHRAIDSIVGLYLLGWGAGPLFRAVYAETYVEQKDHLAEGFGSEGTPQGPIYSEPAAQVPGYNDAPTPQTPTYVTI